MTKTETQEDALEAVELDLIPGDVFVDSDGCVVLVLEGHTVDDKRRGVRIGLAPNARIDYGDLSGMIYKIPDDSRPARLFKGTITLHCSRN